MIHKSNTTNLTREEWLEQRRRSIGGSDAAAVLGLNRFHSPYALWAEKIGAAGLDVVEDEVGLYHNDWKNTVIQNKYIPLLRGFNNVIVTSHKAYYTDQSVSDMVRNSLLGCYYEEHGMENPFAV